MLNIKFEPKQGTISFYVATNIRTPTQAEHQWSSDSILPNQFGVKTLTINNEDPNFVTGTYYIGVYAHYNDSSFTLLATKEAELPNGQSLKGLQSDQDSVQCSNCDRFVPRASYVLHSATCLRQNWKCPVCKQVVPVPTKDKHMLVHQQVKCECGFEGEPDLVELHKRYECRLAPVQCPYCGLSIKFAERGSHVNSCGSRTTTCKHCGSILMRRDFRTHMNSVHGVYPSDSELYE
eukprot:TRINITY_DN10253_c0_g1_i1.p1 TRINITY_DN10253_c0_g1~~TRINITY_DN10253_c0_g1_i1.p1  ORF type:complete len:235 (-),score=22.71 TRINITY_DN10253_c0_g1_i1:68-772(-)